MRLFMVLLLDCQYRYRFPKYKIKAVTKSSVRYCRKFDCHQLYVRMSSVIWQIVKWSNGHKVRWLNFRWSNGQTVRWLNVRWSNVICKLANSQMVKQRLRCHIQARSCKMIRWLIIQMSEGLMSYSGSCQIVRWSNRCSVVSMLTRWLVIWQLSPNVRSCNRCHPDPQLALIHTGVATAVNQ